MSATLTPTTQYGADVETTSITVEGVDYAYPFESGYLTQYGEQEIIGHVKDARGHTGTATQKITVIAYSAPKVQAASNESNIVARRCDKDGNFKDDGTYLKIKAKLVYEKVMVDGVQKNIGLLQYRYREEGGVWSEWVTILDSRSSTATEVTTGALLNGALSTTDNYQVQVRAIDNIVIPEPVQLSVASETVYMDRPAGGRSMGLGGYAQGNGNLDIYWKTKARGGLSLFTESGEELSATDIVPLPRGEVAAGWNPNSISNGLHVVENSAYPLKDAMGNVLMENGVLVQMAAVAGGSVLLQMALPTDSYSPVYRIRWYGLWTDWNTFKI